MATGITSTTFTTTTTDISSDVSSSLSVLSNSLANETNPEHARTIIEKQQLLHQCEMMRIEIEQKSQQILDMQSQHTAEVEEHEEKLRTLQHSNHVLQFKLSTSLGEHKKELAAAQAANSDQILLLQRKQAEIESLLPGFQVKAAELRNLLLNIHVTPEQYSELSVKRREDLSIKELIHVTFYESQRPLHRQVEDLTAKITAITNDYETTKKEVRVIESNLVAEKKTRVEIEAENSSLLRKIDDLTHQLDPAHKANYINVVEKNKELESTNKQLVTANTFMKAELSSLKEDNKKVNSSSSHFSQQVALLNQDKQYLTKENSELISRIHRLEERAENLTVELNNTKRARDSVYEELVSVRHNAKEEHERKLQDELDALKQRTGNEMQLLKDAAIKVYEREKLILLESKEAAINDRNEAIRKNRELQLQYQELADSYHAYQTTTNTKLAESGSEVKLKVFESDRMKMLHSEMTLKYSNLARDHEKLTKKHEILLDDYNTCKMDHDHVTNTLTLKLRAAQNELASYTKTDDNFSEFISTLGEENVSINRNQLAKKLVELSRNNEVLRETVNTKSEALERALEQVQDLQTSLHHSNQPNTYLVDSIKKREAHVKQLKIELEGCRGELDRYKALHKTLLSEKDQLTLDMEKVLKNRSKILDLKKTLNEKLDLTARIQPKPVIFSK